MKKYMSYFLALVLTLGLCIYAYADNPTGLKSDGVVRVTLTSAIDGSPLPVEFDESTGVVSVLDANGAVRYTRKVGSNTDFRELVAINKKVTSQPLTKRKASDRVNRNVRYIEVDRGVLVEFDANGNKRETVLTKEHAAMFPTSRVFTGDGLLARSVGATRAASVLLKDVRGMSIPKASSPDTGGKLLGGAYYTTPSDATSVDLWTYNIPSSVKRIDAYITNEWGDDNNIDNLFWNIPQNTDMVFEIRYGGEPYGAFVSSSYGSGTVRLSLYASL